MEDVRHVRLQASAAEAAAATRFQRRHSPACQELMYVSDGDRNGVCHFLGRACGTRQWVNPVSAGTIKVGSPALHRPSDASMWLAAQEVSDEVAVGPCSTLHSAHEFKPACCESSHPSVLPSAALR